MRISRYSFRFCLCRRRPFRYTARRQPKAKAARVDGSGANRGTAVEGRPPLGGLLPRLLPGPGIDDQWHIWYKAYDPITATTATVTSCYARSKDGIHWKKPSLGIYSLQRRQEQQHSRVRHSWRLRVSRRAGARGRAIQGRGRSNNTPVSSGGSTAHVARRHPLEMARRALAQEKLRHADRLHPRRQRLSALRADVERSGVYRGYRMVGYTESATFGGFPIRWSS